MNVLFSNRLIDSLICSDRSKEEESIKKKEGVNPLFLSIDRDNYIFLIHQKEIDMYLMESNIVRRAPKRFLGQLSSLIHRSNALGSSHGDGGKSQNVVVLLLFAALMHSLLSPASSHIERKSAEPRPDL